MGDSPNLTVLRAQLGGELKQLAEAAGKSPADVAGYIGVSTSTVSKIYNGRQAVKVSQVRSIARLCEATTKRENDLVALASQAARPGWWAEYAEVIPEWFRHLLGLEAAADEIAVYEMELVPGLVQTASYTEAIARAAHPDQSDEEIARLVAFRQARQHHLNDGRPPRLRIILNEAVLCRPVGTAEVWRQQLEHLVKLADDPRVTVQVLTFASGAHPVMGSSFKLLRFESEPSLTTTVYLENDRSGGLLKRPADIRRYMSVFDQMASTAATPEESRDMLVRVVKHV